MNDNFYQEIRNMRIRCRDYCDKPDDSMAHQIDELFEKLENEARSDANVYTIKDDLKRMMDMTRRAADQAVMSRGDADNLSDWAEDMLKKFQ